MCVISSYGEVGISEIPPQNHFPWSVLFNELTEGMTDLDNSPTVIFP